MIYQNLEVPSVCYEDEAYPHFLREISNPPQMLYYLGDIGLLNERKCVSIVGSRRATSYGKKIAIDLAKNCVEAGLLVVSGLAMGIDTFAHEGALDAGGMTAAILGAGINYPANVATLNARRRIDKNGIVISEFPPDMAGTKWTFPMRNRIISGLSLATIVVEAGIKSGAIITAELACEQGREVYAVPGNIDKESSLGCNKLIMDMATPLLSTRDIVSAILPKKKVETIDQETPANLSDTEQKIYNEIRLSGEVTFAELAARMNRKLADVSGIVTVMELKGVLYTCYGRIMCK